MTRFEQAEQRTEAMERQLAAIQTENAILDIQAHLMLQAVNKTLTAAVCVARDCVSTLDQIGDSFEESVERMQRDLTGRD